MTGGAGYIGSCLLPELLKKHRVRVLDNLMYSYNGLINHAGDPNFEFIRGDIRNSKDIRRCLKDVDFVIHLAALVGYPSCKAQPTMAHEINYIGTKNLVDQCAVPVIFASTGSCYGSVNVICDEKTIVQPVTEYAATKIQAEKEIQRCSEYIIYRFSTGFGVSPRLRLDLLVNDFVVRAVKNKELIIFQKNYVRSFIHVKDIVRSFLFALDHFNAMNHGIYNVGSEQLNVTKEDVALRIKKYVDFYLKFAEFGEDPDKRNYKVSFKKISALGFKTKYSLDYGIEELVKALAFIDYRKECYYNSRIFS